MPSKTPNYNLWLYGANETTERFFDFRVNIAGTQQASNFVILDTVLHQIAQDVEDLQSQPSAFSVEGHYTTDNFYSADVTGYTTPQEGQLIVLTLDKTNDGAVSIGINSAPTVSVQKIDITGTSVTLESNDIIENKPILCVYKSGTYIAIGIQSAKDIYIDGTSGQILAVGTNNEISATSAELGKANGIATLDANGKLSQVANVADKATLAETAEAVKSGSIVTDSFADDAIAPEATKVSEPLVIQLKASDDPTKKVYMFDGSESVDIIITPESIGVENTAVYIYKIPVLAENWAENTSMSTENVIVYQNQLSCENVTSDTVLSDITLDSSDVGNLAAEGAAVMWKYLETGDSTITLYANNNKPESDFHLVARELKGTEYTATAPTPSKTNVALSNLTQVGGNAASEGVEAVTTTGLQFTLSPVPTGMTISDITLTGATLGTLTQGENGVFSVTISDITVTSGESVAMTLSDFGDYHFDPASATAVVYVA